MTENELDEQVVALCRKYQLWTMHIPDSRQVDSRGWPDRVFIGPKGALFRELKTAAGSLTHDQRLVGYRMKGAGLDWAVWRPDDLRDGTIEAELRRIAGA